MNKILFNPDGPRAIIPCIEMKQCPEALLRMCNIPNHSRVNVANGVNVSVIGESIFVRGVNSCFVPVQTESGNKYYVHERFVRD